MVLREVAQSKCLLLQFKVNSNGNFHFDYFCTFQGYLSLLSGITIDIDNRFL